MYVCISGVMAWRSRVLPCMTRCPCMAVRVVYPPFVSCVWFMLTCEIDTLADSHVHLVKVLKKHELCSVVISMCQVSRVS